MTLPGQVGNRIDACELRWQTAQVDGIHSRYLVGGSGPHVVLLHGFGLANRTYRSALEQLARRGMRVYAPTLPGFGGAVAIMTAFDSPALVGRSAPHTRRSAPSPSRAGVAGCSPTRPGSAK
ncbi:alpha/beta fold hydrolase [Nocardia huaxiensis]|uniref:alpha/beta fold hydrolase n=1 Tax=Nocardia huaxiensis TaxID=2755382 RepID=UPI001E37F53E|nr:alpha/beta fold hydrolase [Nocardia huaxiensis]UFS98425.1 hypothetical protein LPY97_11240 [Nocardia huaxiensis]